MGRAGYALDGVGSIVHGFIGTAHFSGRAHADPVKAAAK